MSPRTAHTSSGLALMSMVLVIVGMPVFLSYDRASDGCDGSPSLDSSHPPTINLVRVTIATPAATGPAAEAALLALAAAGDERAFERLTAPHRRELLVHCYRMLGSIDDAEDAVQEALLKAWRGLTGFAGRSSVRAWLYRIATNTCLDALDHRARRILPTAIAFPADPHHAPEPDAPDLPWLQPYPDVLLEP